MKTIVSILLLTLTLSFAYGQEKVIVHSSDNILSIRDKGIGYITLPEHFTKEEVNDKSKYYHLYFTVDFDENSKIATIKMVDNTSRSRMIINRFLTGCKISTIEIDGESLNKDEFFEKYLK